MNRDAETIYRTVTRCAYAVRAQFSSDSVRYGTDSYHAIFGALLGLCRKSSVYTEELAEELISLAVSDSITGGSAHCAAMEDSDIIRRTMLLSGEDVGGAPEAVRFMEEFFGDTAADRTSACGEICAMLSEIERSA